MQLEAPDEVAITVGRANYQRLARDVALVRATLAACQEVTKTWFCCPVQIRIDVDEIIRSVP